MANPTVGFELRQPIRFDDAPQPIGLIPGWLRELREMRGRVWYDGGRRPFFRKSDGAFDDADPADLYAYHIIVREGGRPVGCSRLVPLLPGRPSFVVQYLGEDTFARILRRYSARRQRTCEASRWVVVPEHRNGLGAHIVAATWAIAQRLGYELAFVLACTSQHQDRALVRLGARVVEGLGTFRVDHFVEDGRLLSFDALHPPGFMQERMARVRRDFALDALVPAFQDYSEVA